MTISNRSVQFTPLKSSDEGTYSFSVRVEPLDSKYLCPSSFVNDSIDISPSKCTTYTITVFMHMITSLIYAHGIYVLFFWKDSCLYKLGRP